MTKEYYFSVFGQLSVTEEQKKLLLVDRNFTDGEIQKNEEEYTKKEFAILNFDESNQVSKSVSNSGCCAFELNENIPYSPIIEGQYQDLTVKDHAWIRVSANVFPTQQDIDENAFSLTIAFNHKGYSYKYRALDANKMNLVPNEWNKVELEYLTPEVRFTTDDFRTMFWYRGKTVLYVDDFKVEVLEKN